MDAKAYKDYAIFCKTSAEEKFGAKSFRADDIKDLPALAAKLTDKFDFMSPWLQERVDKRIQNLLVKVPQNPECESTPARLAALNHGTITTPIPGQEATTVLNKCKTWSARVGQLKIQESASVQPTITLQLSGVDTKRILDQAGSLDNHGNRVRKRKDILIQQMGIVAEE